MSSHHGPDNLDYPDYIFGGGPWTARLENIVATMREMSRQTDPQRMVQIYRERLATVTAVDGFLSVSRRGVDAPSYLIAQIGRASCRERV